MIMIVGASSADASDPIGVLIFLAALGFAAVFAGGRLAFNVRGAVDATLARRRAVLELKAQSTGDLGLPDTWSFSPFFFKFLGSVTMVAVFVLLALGLVLVTD
ncbi:hypothetical protein [Streptomyces violaceorubidus]|uniref:hypothetical protein n=1 Tax=Streptomyces violaceorubidus TaxID=284042 RepID=UPI0012FF4619|nr:hypothetical protein [Streptomyces violaceorubidus]